MPWTRFTWILLALLLLVVAPFVPQIFGVSVSSGWDGWLGGLWGAVIGALVTVGVAAFAYGHEVERARQDQLERNAMKADEERRAAEERNRLAEAAYERELWEAKQRVFDLGRRMRRHLTSHRRLLYLDPVITSVEAYGPSPETVRAIQERIFVIGTSREEWEQLSFEWILLWPYLNSISDKSLQDFHFSFQEAVQQSDTLVASVTQQVVNLLSGLRALADVNANADDFVRAAEKARIATNDAFSQDFDQARSALETPLKHLSTTN